jgi:hypothetical protein
MKTAFLVTNRNMTKSGLGNNMAKSLSYYSAPLDADLAQWSG